MPDLREPARAKAVEESEVRLAQIMSDHDTNLYGTIHGGILMKFVDDAAAATAARHCDMQAVTVSVDHLVFTAPVRVGDLVVAVSRIASVGRSSMAIDVEMLAAPSSRTVPQARVATARLTFVAIGPDGKPQKVPGLLSGD